MKDTPALTNLLQPSDDFVPRHIGPSDAEVQHMLSTLGLESLQQLVEQTVPADIRLKAPLKLDPPRAEFETLNELRAIAAQNRVARSMIGQGYYDTIVPPVIQRNILENPGWYTQYTPYQAEISQGRLEALINFQTMIADLTGLPLANASLLDEATAAAEAMFMCHALCEDDTRTAFLVVGAPEQTRNVLSTRAHALGWTTFGGPREPAPNADWPYFGVLLQYPDVWGSIHDYSEIIEKAHANGAKVVMATDLLALTLIKPPGEWGADIAVGSSQRFGVPLGFGGPHAAFMATREEFKRHMPGRIIGVSKDVHGKPAYRLAIQTREQHIRREKATSNICTAQVLLAVMAGMYAVYHGPGGLRRIAERTHRCAVTLARGLRRLGYEVSDDPFFDTIGVRLKPGQQIENVRAELAEDYGINVAWGGTEASIACDETTSPREINALLTYFNEGRHPDPRAELERQAAEGGCDDSPAHRDYVDRIAAETTPNLSGFERRSAYLTHPVFNTHHSEHEMLRYIRKLESRDLSLTTSMISLGSCTMKLNATAEMFPVSWPEFARIHPYAPADQTTGYAEMLRGLAAWLCEITGFAAVSLQPNSGAQGEYAGLLAIRGYHRSRGDKHRTTCLIPVSAHGTNPASAAIAGFTVVAVKCDANGNVDISDLRAKAAEHALSLGALMITYPSTHGVFEPGIREICALVHQHGGQVYMDGANMNAQVGLTRPADIGADVCHLNLHKTFCIPHGGGGPGMGPIAVAEHLAPFLPQSPVWTTGSQPPSFEAETDKRREIDELPITRHPDGYRGGTVSAAPYGSASILPISWMYIRMMGGTGLTRATQIAILNANYMAKRLEAHYPVLYRGANGRVAHEFIIDCRQFEAPTGVKVEDIAKRLMDYGFHAPTMSFPVPGTLMIEPTESESQPELDRFCDALIAIREEIRAIEQGRLDRTDNPLKNAPHTAAAVCSTEWMHPYPREQGAFPAAWVRAHKFWPAVGRIDNVWGDRNLFCTCPPMDAG